MSAGERPFRPSVTVAAVVEHDGRFLLVEEHTPEGLRLNNPAGHLDAGESPLQAVVRETLEETARRFEPEALLGVYLARFQRPASGEDITYVRFAFRGRVGEPLMNCRPAARATAARWSGAACRTTWRGGSSRWRCCKPTPAYSAPAR